MDIGNCLLSMCLLPPLHLPKTELWLVGKSIPLVSVRADENSGWWIMRIGIPHTLQNELLEAFVIQWWYCSWIICPTAISSSLPAWGCSWPVERYRAKKGNEANVNGLRPQNMSYVWASTYASQCISLSCKPIWVGFPYTLLANKIIW